MDKRKSIQVDEQTWLKLRQYALEQRTTVGKVVASLAQPWKGGPAIGAIVCSDPVTGVSMRPVTEWTPETPTRKPKANHVAATDGASSAGQRAADRVAGMAALAAVDGEVRCQCGQRWRDHQSGESGKLAVVTNCRRFQP